MYGATSFRRLNYGSEIAGYFTSHFSANRWGATPAAPTHEARQISLSSVATALRSLYGRNLVEL